MIHLNMLMFMIHTYSNLVFIAVLRAPEAVLEVLNTSRLITVNKFYFCRKFLNLTESCKK
jgi:hypothetical protein